MRKLLKWVGILIFGLIALVIGLGVIGAITATPEQKAKWAQEAAERDKQRQIEKAKEAKALEQQRAMEEAQAKIAAQKKAQFKCAEYETGGMYDFLKDLKDNLRDPESFDKIATYAEPVEGDGTQLVRLKYRAKNGFGGMNIAMAEARLNNADCKLISWRSLE